jgi:hypothetical protein
MNEKKEKGREMILKFEKQNSGQNPLQEIAHRCENDFKKLIPRRAVFPPNNRGLKINFNRKGVSRYLHFALSAELQPTPVKYLGEFLQRSNNLLLYRFNTASVLEFTCSFS